MDLWRAGWGNIHLPYVLPLYGASKVRYGRKPDCTSGHGGIDRVRGKHIQLDNLISYQHVQGKPLHLFERWNFNPGEPELRVGHAAPQLADQP